VIGGLIATGMAAKGAESLGWAKLGITAIGWVASPIVGALTTFLILVVIRKCVHLQPNPAERARFLQPAFTWGTFSVCLLFMVIKGPSVMKVKPIWLAVIVAFCGGGIMMVLYKGCEYLREAYCPGEEEETAAQAAAALEAGSSDEKGIEIVLQTPTGETCGIDGIVLSDGAAPAKAKANPGKPAAGEEGEETEAAAAEEQAPGLFSDTVEVNPAETAADQQKKAEKKEKGGSDDDDKGSGGDDDDDPGSASDDEGPGSRGYQHPDHIEIEKPFVPLLIISALTVAFAHGANDVGNAVGPLAIIYQIHMDGTIDASPDIPMWALCMGASGFVVGIILLGSKTINTVGSSITTLTPSRSYATQMGAAVAVLASSVLGLPVSTSHCLIGSILGVGFAQSCTGESNEMDFGVLKRIVMTWILTIPAAMLVAFLVFAPLESTFS